MMLLGLEAARLPLPEEPVATGWPAARERFLRWYWETTARMRAGQGPRTLFWLRLGIRWWLNADFHNVQLPILAAATLLWAITAWVAWRGEESLRIVAAPQPAVLTAPATFSNTSRRPEPVTPNSAQQSSANAQEPSDSTFRSFAQRLVALFLPESEENSTSPGNPRVRVWVDKRTGLYYCPGDDHPAGRDRGKIMTQRAAQLDYFQPAYNAPCF
jgi:hypothetical protein